ncbi:MAG: hypothetical protein HYZ94_03115 [Candidatus Omnitrophica bacterium]|nr:hypothetical protein [Candidatus Omnitrophota bacterium]
MRTWRGATTLGLLSLLALAVVVEAARAEYTPRGAAAGRAGGVDAGAAGAGEDEFSRAVDLSRFRKGNIGWDTQELIVSGLTALHRENQRILRELEEIKETLSRLEAKD